MLTTAQPERARELVWEYEALHPKDALDVATALDANFEQFDTFDRELLALFGRIGGSPLTIGNPNLQEPLF